MFHLVPTMHSILFKKKIMVYIYLKSISKICVIVWCYSFANLFEIQRVESFDVFDGSTNIWFSIIHENS
jgi:hypothetical protein